MEAITINREPVHWIKIIVDDIRAILYLQNSGEF